MCDFCTRHGDGKKWYLNARNYAVELLDELERKKFIAHFYRNVIKKGQREISVLERFFGGRFSLPQKIRSRNVRQNQKSHFGQLIPIEEIPEILKMTNSITRVTCGCRWAVEKKESRVCYGLSTGPPHWYDELDMNFFGSPDVSRLEHLSREDALEAMTENDRKGMVHSLWTFETPFIGAICNCDGRYCLAMRTTRGMKIPSMFRAEYVAEIDQDTCDGCEACRKRCPFQAVHSPGKHISCTIDPSLCYGCGVCRAICPRSAIRLQARASHPVAREIWV